MGRAARHVKGAVIMYADNITGSMKRAIAEVERRKMVQTKYNLKHKITPRSIKKPIRQKLIEEEDIIQPEEELTKFKKIDWDQLTPYDKKLEIKKMEKKMRMLARELEFEKAAKIRDFIKSISIN
jgi:excinuclease ABC subunit B